MCDWHSNRALSPFPLVLLNKGAQSNLDILHCLNRNEAHYLFVPEPLGCPMPQFLGKLKFLFNNSFPSIFETYDVIVVWILRRDRAYAGESLSSRMYPVRVPSYTSIDVTISGIQNKVPNPQHTDNCRTYAYRVPIALVLQVLRDWQRPEENGIAWPKCHKPNNHYLVLVPEDDQPAGGDKPKHAITYDIYGRVVRTELLPCGPSTRGLPWLHDYSPSRKHLPIPMANSLGFPKSTKMLTNLSSMVDPDGRSPLVFMYGHILVPASIKKAMVDKLNLFSLVYCQPTSGECPWVWLKQRGSRTVLTTKAITLLQTVYDKFH